MPHAKRPSSTNSVRAGKLAWPLRRALGRDGIASVPLAELRQSGNPAVPEPGRIRGFRIDLREITAHLLEHPAVREALVVGQGSTPGDQRLVAYYVAAEPVGVEALRAHLDGRLPDYLVPVEYVESDALPAVSEGIPSLRGLPVPEENAERETEHNLEEEFRRLACRWRDETEHLSSTDVFTHPDYQRIIGMGSAVVPLILRDLASTGSHWFWALRAITGVNPVRAEDTGYVRKMTRAWLEWGRREGLYA